jgi:hypothetical protein
MTDEKNIDPLSPFFLIILGIAFLFDMLSGIMGLIELLISGGFPLISGLINILGMITIGVWLWKQGKKDLWKQIFGSGVVEAIPLVHVFAPTWSLNVVSVLKEKRQIYIILLAAAIILPLIMMVIAIQITPVIAEPGTSGGKCGFDTSKFGTTYKYEGGGPAEPDENKVMDPVEGKAYALGIGVPEENIKIWATAAEHEQALDLFRKEVYAQWPSISDVAQQNGSNIVMAQRAVLTYAVHEGGLYKFKETDQGLVPYVARWDSGECKNYPTFHPPSITCWIYKESKNMQYAIAWDIKYSIHIGVKEIFNHYIAASGTGEEKWKKALQATFQPGSQNSFWNSTSNTAWDEYFADETPQAERINQECVSLSNDKMVEVPLIKQAATPWGSMPYGNCGGSSYAESACGATSLTMVINYFTGNNFAVNEIGDEVVARGWRVCGQGTAWAAMTGIPELHGLTSRDLGFEWSGVEECFRGDGIVIASMSDCQFTNFGHFIVLTGLSNDTVYINDPGGRNITQAPVSDVTSSRCGLRFWCINNK